MTFSQRQKQVKDHKFQKLINFFFQKLINQFDKYKKNNNQSILKKEIVS